MKFPRLATALLGCLAVSAAQADLVYFNDFSLNANGFSGATNIEVAPGNGQRFLGALANSSSSTLTLSGLASHTSVTLTFSLYALNSLDGDGTSCCGPDAFRVEQGANVLMNNTFSNVTTWSQSYGGAGSAGGTGSNSALTGVLGYFFWGPDHTYDISLTFAHTDASLALRFIGASDQAWSDEGFGIDNVRVSTNAAASGGSVPVSSSLALASLGLGLFTLGRRGRRSRS